MNLRTHAPWIIGGATVVSVVFIICLTVLAFEGKQSEELSRILNSGLNLLGALLAGGAYWRASQATEQAGGARQEARGAQQEARVAAQQTNGALDDRIAQAVHRVLDQREGRA